MSWEIILQNVLIIFLFVLYVVAIELKNLLHSVIILGGGGIVLAVVFYMLKAPDIAITQAAVGAGVATTAGGVSAGAVVSTFVGAGVGALTSPRWLIHSSSDQPVVLPYLSRALTWKQYWLAGLRPVTT
jgi:energy-converting hydrogenase B subunit D